MRFTGLAVFCFAAAASAREPISASGFFELSESSLTLELDEDGDSPLWTYDPNTDVRPGFEFRYGYYGISMVPSLFGEERYDSLRPPTKYLDLKGSYFGNRWGFELYHHYFRGFSLWREYEDTWKDNPSMTVTHSAINVYRTLLPDSRMFRVVEGIRGTGVKANVYGIASFSRADLNSPTGLMEGVAAGQGTVFDSLSRLRAYTITAGAGATLNLSLFGFYADPTLMMAFGPQYRDSDADIEAFSDAIKVNLKLNLGYANKYFNAGMQVSGDSNDVSFGKQAVAFDAFIVRLGLTFFL